MKTLFLLLFLSVPAVAAERPLERGRLEFQVDTNVKAFRFKGEATEMKGTFAVTGNELKAFRAVVPVQALTTHMSLRDSHMKERVFTRPDGTTPDVTLVGQKFDCRVESDQSQLCQVTGEMTIRGETRPVTFPARITRASDGSAVAQGLMDIQLSQFGVEVPSHMGIKVNDPVKVDFEVKGKP